MSRFRSIHWFTPIALVVGLLIAPATRAAVKPVSLFSSHMVLQQDIPVPIWGTAEPGEAITVTIQKQILLTHADKDGRWMVTLQPLKPGKPTEMTIVGTNKITIDDVLIGEVWLCSGQSNMAMTVARSKDFADEQKAATTPEIRMFLVSSGAASTPQTECKGKWTVCSPETVGTFTATGYFFAQELHKQIKRPVGLIHSSVGGTPIEAWTRRAAMDATPTLKPVLDRWQKNEENFDPAKAKATYEKQLKNYEKLAAEGKAPAAKPRAPMQPSQSTSYPAVLYNGKIAPLERYALRGALWYQGESNAGSPTAELYEAQLKLLVTDWRARWGQGDFPFAWVQLPNYQTAAQWPIVREGMLKTLRLPNTGMAVTIDVGDPKDIHPTNKQPVGKRLAYWALAKVYDQDRPYSGPIVKSITPMNDQIRITFTHADGGLKAKADSLGGFQIAGADQKWHTADAKIEGKDTVIVQAKAVSKPVAVRYLWENNPEASLYNAADLPASPFRSDDWDGLLPKAK